MSNSAFSSCNVCKYKDILSKRKQIAIGNVFNRQNDTNHIWRRNVTYYMLQICTTYLVHPVLICESSERSIKHIIYWPNDALWPWNSEESTLININFYIHTITLMCTHARQFPWTNGTVRFFIRNYSLTICWQRLTDDMNRK